MRSRWLLSVAACLIGTGIALAQPTKSPLTSTGEPRAVVPSDLKAPTNRLPERAVIRGFAGSDDSRAQLTTPLGRTLTQPDASARGYTIDQGAKRAISGAATPRDSALLRVQPGDKVNKIPDANSNNRNFIAPTGGRAALPLERVVPSDRRVIGDR